MGLVKEKQAKMDLSNIGDPDEFAKGKPKLGAPGTWHQQDSDDDLFQPASLSVTVDGQNAKAQAAEAGILASQPRVSRPSNIFGKVSVADTETPSIG